MDTFSKHNLLHNEIKQTDASNVCKLKSIFQEFFLITILDSLLSIEYKKLYLKNYIGVKII